MSTGPVEVSMQSLVRAWPRTMADDIYESTGRKVQKTMGFDWPWHGHDLEFLYIADHIKK